MSRSGIDRWGDSFESKPFWTTWKAAVAATLIVLGIIAIVGVATTGSVFFQAGAAKITNPARVQIKVYDPNNTIAQIAFFHDQCEQVNAGARIASQNEQKFLLDKQTLAGASDPISQQQARDALLQDSQDVTGAKNVLQTRAADYNSRSAQRTANPFKDAGLPVRIDVPTNDRDLVNFQVNCGSAR